VRAKGRCHFTLLNHGDEIVHYITFLDSETSGLDQSDGHRIIEFASITYDLATRVERLRFVQRIHPQRTIQAAAQAIHHIDISELTGCPIWDTVAPKIAKILSLSQTAVAHNAEFDLPFIAMELSRIGLAVPNPQVFCTMTEGRWATPVGKLPTLGELCFACDVEYDTSPGKAHGALYDVEVMSRCFWKALDWGFYKLELPATEKAA
jgi:DNA polymerase-3 subunit epsilon